MLSVRLTFKVSGLFLLFILCFYTMESLQELMNLGKGVCLEGEEMRQFVIEQQKPQSENRLIQKDFEREMMAFDERTATDKWVRDCQLEEMKQNWMKVNMQLEAEISRNNESRNVSINGHRGSGKRKS